MLVPSHVCAPQLPLRDWDARWTSACSPTCWHWRKSTPYPSSLGESGGPRQPRAVRLPVLLPERHRLVQFSAAEKKNFTQYVRNGGFVFVDDGNHDIDGLFARSFDEHKVCFSPRP
ncbi:MAG: DUF4159 domain-containing protein [Hymenobacter sp.]